MDEKEAEKNVHLEMRELKANRASKTEELRKERLRIRREKDRARRRPPKNYTEEKKRSSKQKTTRNRQSISKLVRYGVRMRA